jgi:hypothetical protein
MYIQGVYRPERPRDRLFWCCVAVFLISIIAAMNTLSLRLIKKSPIFAQPKIMASIGLRHKSSTSGGTGEGGNGGNNNNNTPSNRRNGRRPKRPSDKYFDFTSWPPSPNDSISPFGTFDSSNRSLHQRLTSASAGTH